MRDGSASFLSPEPAGDLTQEEKERLLATLTARCLAVLPPEEQPPVAHFVWSRGQMLDITCPGCRGKGCNRCRGRGRVGAGGTREDVRPLPLWSRSPRIDRLVEAMRLFWRKGTPLWLALSLVESIVESAVASGG